MSFLFSVQVYIKTDQDIIISEERQGQFGAKNNLQPGWIAHLVGALLGTPKDCGFDSQSGNIPRFWVQSSVGHVWEAINRCLSLKSINVYHWVMIKINKIPN